jgi:catechol 2,3-dioxygenase-like lactoylglutathione lyase family enzyme
VASVQSRRHLHCAWSTPSWEGTSRFLVDGLGLVAARPGPIEPSTSDGGILGFDAPMTTRSCFFYDHRGPAAGPGIELQGWMDPPAVGEPYRLPHHVGLQAIGLSTADLSAAVAMATACGARDAGAWGHVPLPGTRGATVIAAGGTSVDLVERPGVTGNELSHLRISSGDLDRSVAFYTDLGFEVRQRDEPVQGPVFGSGTARAELARMGLPDAAFELVLVQWHEPASYGEPYGSANHSGYYRFAMLVPDARAAASALEAGGIDILRAPQAVSMGGAAPDMWIAFIHDPDGVVVQLASTR